VPWVAHPPLFRRPEALRNASAGACTSAMVRKHTQHSAGLFPAWMPPFWPGPRRPGLPRLFRLRC